MEVETELRHMTNRGVNIVHEEKNRNKRVGMRDKENNKAYRSKIRLRKSKDDETNNT